MTKQRAGLERVKRKLARDPRRSPLFHWLMDRYDELAPAVTGPRATWSALRERAIRAGVTDDAGQPPSERTVRETFRKVEKAAAALAAVAAIEPPAKRPPSRLPDSLRPLEAPRPAAPPPPPAPQQGQAHPPAPAAGMSGQPPSAGGALEARSPPEAYDPEKLSPAEQEEILKRRCR